jgi:peptidoglycan/LPS O-acetylase OafA/YrhL
LSLASFRGRIPSLDGMRGIAAIAVVLPHLNIFFLPQAKIPFQSRSYLAVDLFFLLSGFVMAHVYGDQLAHDRAGRWRDFARNRFARIYPLFLLTTAVLVIAFLFFQLSLPWVSFSASSLLLNFLMLQEWCFEFSGEPLSWNYPSWSIGTEAAAYLFFIFAARRLIAGNRPWTMVMLCLLPIAALSIRHRGSLNDVKGAGALARTLASFSLGVLFYRLYPSLANIRRHLGWMATVFLIAGSLLRFDILIVAALASAMCWAIEGPRLVSSILNCRYALTIGDWSYGIYLWHAPIHYLVMAGALAVFGRPLSSLDRAAAIALDLATIAAVIAAAGLSYRYFETPMRRRLAKKRAATAPVLDQAII